MTIDHESHKQLLLSALSQLKIEGPVLHPDLIQQVKLAQDVYDSILSATIGANVEYISDESGIGVGYTTKKM